MPLQLCDCLGLLIAEADMFSNRASFDDKETVVVGQVATVKTVAGLRRGRRAHCRRFKDPLLQSGRIKGCSTPGHPPPGVARYDDRVTGELREVAMSNERMSHPATVSLSRPAVPRSFVPQRNTERFGVLHRGDT